MVAIEEIVGALILNFPIIEVGVIIFLTVALRDAWKGIRAEDYNDTDEQKSLGLSVTTASLGGIITGSSVIMTGIAAFLSMSNPLGVGVKIHTKFAFIYAFLALAIVVYTYGVLPARVLGINLIRSKEIAFICAYALFFVLMAAFRFMFAVLTHLYA